MLTTTSYTQRDPHVPKHGDRSVHTCSVCLRRSSVWVNVCYVLEDNRETSIFQLGQAFCIDPCLLQ